MLKTTCKPFTLATGININKQSAQNNEQMKNSLTVEAKVTLLTYCKDNKVLVNGEFKVVASLMYNTIMPLATLDKNATLMALRTNLVL
jgi:predicted glycosyltransferase